MLRSLRRPKRWPVLLGIAVVIVIVTIVAIVAISGGDDEKDGGDDGGIQRSPDTPIVIPAGEPIIIGVSAALTGPTETQGTESRDATVVGVERWKEKSGKTIGGHEIEVHAEDDGCFEADITAQAAKRLLRVEGLVGVIGPMCSDGAATAIPIYTEAGIVMISGSATRTDLTDQPEPRFFFRTAYSNAQEGAEQARYIFARLPDVATVYLVDDGELYGQDLADKVQAALEASGRAVIRLSIVTGSVDFSDLVNRIATDNPGVVIFEGFNPEGALLYRQLQDAGYRGLFMGSDGTATETDFIVPLGDQAEGAVLAGCSPALPDEFHDYYIKIIGHAPTSAFAGHYADAATILLDAVAKVAVEQADGSLVINPLQLRDAVSNAMLPTGLTGDVVFDENGDRIGEGKSLGLAMCVVESGQFVDLGF